MINIFLNKKIIGIIVCLLFIMPISSVSADSNKQLFINNFSDWPTQGTVGVEYNFCIDISQDPMGDYLFVLFDWGDDSDSGWLGLYSPGENICSSHAWNESGDYEIIVKIKNESDVIVWQSDTFYIHIGAPILQIEILLGRNLRVTVSNVGDGDAIDVYWSLDIVGGFFGFIDYHIGGTVDILTAGNKTSVETFKAPCGFGKIDLDIRVGASNSEESVYLIDGRIFFFLIIIL